MARVEHKTLIKTTPEEAFDYIVKPANRPNWLGSVMDVSNISEGPLGIGTTWNEKQKIAGRRLEYCCKMTEFNRPRKWAMELDMLGVKSRLENSFDIHEDGRVCMTLIIDYTLPGSFIGQIADRLLFERIFEKTCRENAGTVKIILESKQTGTP
ncbi:MAG: SRPBCC family protein [Dehalococcoidales bacterium]|nr:SRPBCC family protein [Dehalococcoidales bacterium]